MFPFNNIKRSVLVALEGKVGVKGRKNLEYGNKF